MYLKRAEEIATTLIKPEKSSKSTEVNKTLNRTSKSEKVSESSQAVTPRSLNFSSTIGSTPKVNANASSLTCVSSLEPQQSSIYYSNSTKIDLCRILK